MRSDPSAGGGKSRRKGFEVSRMKRKSPKLMRFKVPRMRARTRSGRFRAERLTANVHQQSVTTQKSTDPSCEPQTAANL